MGGLWLNSTTLTPIRLSVRVDLIACYPEAQWLPTRLASIISLLMDASHPRGRFLWDLQIKKKERTIFINQSFQLTFAEPRCCRPAVSISRGFIFVKFFGRRTGCKAEVLHCRLKKKKEKKKSRDPLSDTQDDERKEECGTRKKRREGDYSEEEERKSEKVYTARLCSRGAADCAGSRSWRTAVWLFLNERSLEYRWSHFHSPVYWDLAFFFFLISALI